MTFQVEDIKDFWFNSSKSRKLSPLMVVANPVGTKVFGVANDKSDVSGYDTLIFWSGAKRVVQSTSVNFSQQIGQWSAVETWPEDNYAQLIVGGELEGEGVVGFVSFDEKLQAGLFQKVTDNCVTCLSRIIGSQTLLVGTVGKLLELKVTKKSFTAGRVFSLSPDVDFIDIKIRNEKMLALDSHGNVHIRTAKKRFDANLALQRESSLAAGAVSANATESKRPTFHVGGLAAVSQFGAKLTGAIQNRNLQRGETMQVDGDNTSVMSEKNSSYSNMMESIASTIVRKDLLFSNEAQLKASLSQGQIMKINLSDIKNKATRLLCSAADLMIAGESRVAEYGRDGQGPYTFVREIIDKPIHSMSNQNGDLVIQTVDNQLIVWSRISGKSIKTLQGNKDSGDLSDSFMVKQSVDPIESVLWYKGSGDLAILDSSKDYQATNLDNFCQDDQSNPVDPVLAMIISKPLKVIVLMVAKETDFWIKYYDPSKQKEKAYPLQNIGDKDRKKVIEKVVDATMMEESGRTNVFYLAGKCKLSAGPDKGKTILIVCAIKFSSPNLELQDYYALDKKPEFKTVGSLKAINAPNKVDYLLVGTEQVISILKINKDLTFSFVHQFSNLHSGLVMDLDLYGTSLFSICPDDPHLSVVSLPASSKEPTASSEKRKVVEFTDPAISQINLPPGVKVCRLGLAADSSCLIASASTGGVYSINGVKKGKYTVCATTLTPENTPRAVFIKGLTDGSTLVHHQSTSDLVSYDKEWKELNRFSGLQTSKSDKMNRIASFKKSIFTQEERYLLFFKGETNLMKLQLETLDVQEIESFFLPPNKPATEVQSVVAVGDPDGLNLAGLCYASGAAYVCIKEGSESVKFYETKIRMPQISSPSCINSSADGKALLIGGSSDPNFAGFGILAAYTFDKKLKSVCLQLYKDSHHKCISCLSRIRDSSKLIVGMTSTIMIVDFPNNEKFVTLCVVKNVIGSKC